MVLAVERRFITCIDDVKPRRHGAAGSRRQCVMVDARRVVVSSGAMVASTAGLARLVHQFCSEVGPVEYDDDDLCSGCMRCSL